ncbi:hypothetical protein [Agaribacterium haliotis]|uniref:hypothetical protein n=1 Tax=Agaribacterium haliotis TaxID=2013869 RepID=UPI0011777190|nr:hypothetical protein [Agaribacterium haliotis]
MCFISSRAVIAASEPLRVKVASSIDNMQWWAAWMEQRGCDAMPDLERTLRRNELELLLLCRALREADPGVELELVHSANYSRNLRLLLDGKVDVAAESVWANDVAELELYVSSAVLAEGQIVKGIYTRFDHPLRQLPAEKIDLSLYRGVTMQNWTYDWQAVSELTPHATGALNTYSVHKIINSGRADFTLSEFPSGPGLEINCSGEKLYPVPGLKVAMPGSRHFAVSQKSANGAAVYSMLNRGLALMSNTGRVLAAYESIGFFNALTNNWEFMTAELSPNTD